jgi:selenocysteine lyase/cysteine desulfurase
LAGRSFDPLHRGNVTEALPTASELQFVARAEALELTLLLADKEPEKYERAAARWHVRYLQEVPNVDLHESQAVLALFAAIPANRWPPRRSPDLLSRRQSCERIAEALVRWSRNG